VEKTVREKKTEEGGTKVHVTYFCPREGENAIDPSPWRRQIHREEGGDVRNLVESQCTTGDAFTENQHIKKAFSRPVGRGGAQREEGRSNAERFIVG